MRYTTLNNITRSVLQQKKLPIHYYYRFLKYSSDCLQELLYDTLQITNTVRLPINEFHEADIPADCLDADGIIKVGVQVGQFIRPLIPKNSINKLANIDEDTREQIEYPQPSADEEQAGLIPWIGININTNGENTGGYYGLGAGGEPDTYIIDERRNVIQLNQSITNSKIVVEYISDGTRNDAATRITPLAQRTIETYADWQYKEHSKSFGAYDAERAKALFYRELEKLRARKNNLTPELVERIINRHRKATIK
jgi:hypothetical protein